MQHKLTALGRSPLLRTWLGVVFISFSGVLVRQADVEVARSAFLRGAYALPFLWALAAWTRRGQGWPRLDGRALLAGALLGADLVAWHGCIAIIGAGLATVLPNLQVVIVAAAGALLFGERPSRLFWIALPVVLGGVWLLAATSQPITPGASLPLGVGLGLLTALFYSAYLLLLRVARAKAPALSAVEIMSSATLGVTLLTGVVAAYEGVAGPAPTLEANAWLLALALGSQVFGWLLLASSIHRLPAALTAVSLLLQPLLAVIWGVTLLGEPIGPVQLAGAALLLGGVTLAHRAVSARSPRP